VRRRHGLSQRQLALRAGTSQDAVSRIERGAESPTFERLTNLLLAMGERPKLSAEPLTRPLAFEELAGSREMTPRERLYEASSWNRVAMSIEQAGAKALRARR
jgi:transcriptional regulator with XRE-family HTH domain